MHKNHIWTALVAVWIITIASHAKEQFNYDNATIESTINYPITYVKSVPPHDLSSGSLIPLPSSPTWNSIIANSFLVKNFKNNNKKLYSSPIKIINKNSSVGPPEPDVRKFVSKSSTVSKFIDGIDYQLYRTRANKANKGKDGLTLLSNPSGNKFKTVDIINPKTTYGNPLLKPIDGVSKIKSYLIASPSHVSSEPSNNNSDIIKCCAQTPEENSTDVNMLKVSSYKVTYSETQVKSYNNKYNHKNNNGYEFENVKNKEETKSKIETQPDRHFNAPSVEVKNISADNTSDKYNSALLSLLRKGKNEVTSQLNSSDFTNNKVVRTGSDVKLLNMDTSLKGFNRRTDINFRERVSVKVTGNLLEKLVRDKPQTSLANEKSRGNNQESRVKPFVTDKPFRLMLPDTSQLTSYSDKNTASISALSKIYSSDNVTLQSPINSYFSNNNNEGYDIGSVNKNDERLFSTPFAGESDRINETNVIAGTATTYSSLAISALEINEQTMENSVTAITIKDNKNIGRIIKKQEFEINTRLSTNSAKDNWEIKSMVSPKSINRGPFVQMEILRRKKSSNLMNASGNKTMRNETFEVSADKTVSNGVTENIRETILGTDEKRLPSHLRNLGRPTSELLNPLDLLNSTSLSVESGTEVRNLLPRKDISTEAGNPQSSEINGSIHESTTAHPLHARNSGTFHQTDSDPGYYGENVAFNDYRLQASRPLTVTEFTTEISQVERAKMGIDLLSNETKTTPLGNTKASGTKAMDKSALSSPASTSRINDSQILSEKWEHGSLLPPIRQPNANQTINDVDKANAGSTVSSTSAKGFGEQAGKIETDHRQGINANDNLMYGQNDTGVAGARAMGFDKVGMNENSSSVAVNQWPVKHSAIVEGDLVLGGLMMVHEREDTVTCGPVMPQGGVQALEAMLFTLDWLSKRQFIPGVKIGAHILDDCDKDTYGLEMAVDFIKGNGLFNCLFQNIF